MKRRIVFSALALLFTFAAMGFSEKGIFDFVAPVVDNESDSTSQADIGTIVYDLGEDKFYGRTSGSAWQELSPGPNSTQQVVYLKDLQTSGTGGGTTTANTVHTRVLNTVEGDSSIVNLSSNQFTLGAGTYDIEATAPAYAVTNHQIFLYNVTDTSYDIDGMSQYTHTASAPSVNAQLKGRITITSSKIYEIRHWVNSAVTGNGLGVAVNGTNNPQSNEIYTVVKITKAD